VEEGERTPSGDVSARLVPYALLKGTALPPAVRLEEVVLSSDAQQATGNDPYSLVRANRDALSGAAAAALSPEA
jgi:hypothetical protein